MRRFLAVLVASCCLLGVLLREIHGLRGARGRKRVERRRPILWITPKTGRHSASPCVTLRHTCARLHPCPELKGTKRNSSKNGTLPISAPFAFPQTSVTDPELVAEISNTGNSRISPVEWGRYSPVGEIRSDIGITMSLRADNCYKKLKSLVVSLRFNPKKPLQHGFVW